MEMERKITSLLYDGCKLLIAIDCQSPAWEVWVRCRKENYVGRLKSMMKVIRELNGGTSLANSMNQPEVTPMMYRWWIDAHKYIQGEHDNQSAKKI
jgi:hypothetical protein